MTTEAKKRLTTAIMEAISATGELPEGTLRDRVLGHLFEARSIADQLIGQSGLHKTLDAPMSSRMS